MATYDGSDAYTDPFVIPGTNTLRNRFGERDPDKLAAIERVLTQERGMQPLAGVAISAEGFRALHRQLFQDVYQWTGEIRTDGTLSKGDAVFLPGRFVAGALVRQFELLKAEENLRGLSADDFATRAAFHISEINYIHPFREGNGRTMRLFLSELARQAGHNLQVDRIEARAWMEASIQGRETQDHAAMTAVIRGAIT